MGQMTTPMFKTLLARVGQSELLINGDSASLVEGLLHGMSEHPYVSDALASSASNDDFWAFEKGSWRDELRPYEVREGILSIPVKGMLIRNFSYAFFDYLTGYEYIQKAFERGMADPDVKGIALIIDSPGGHAAGCFDAVDKMVAYRGTKPVRAFAHENAYSAAYAIASVADHIVVSRTGGVGSIGVIAAHFDNSRALENAGYKITFVYAGAHKADGQSSVPLSDDAKARMQASVDKMANLFYGTVSANRGITVEAVKAMEALCYEGEDSLSVGLADSVGPLDDSLVTFKASLTNSIGDLEMSKEENIQAITQASVDAAVSDALAKGRAEGATAERARINDILASDAGKVRPKAALAAALTTDMSVETASNFLAVLPEESAPQETNTTDNRQTFNNAMNQNSPNVGGDVGGTDPEAALDGSDDIALMKRFGIGGLI